MATFVSLSPGNGWVRCWHWELYSDKRTSVKKIKEIQPWVLEKQRLGGIIDCCMGLQGFGQPPVVTMVPFLTKSESQVTQRSSWSLSSRGLGMLPGNCCISVPSHRVVNSVKDHEIPFGKSGTNCSYGLQTNHDRIWQQTRIGNWLQFYIFI